LLKVIARRRARDQAVKLRAEAVDPGSRLLAAQVDPEPPLDEVVPRRLDAALVRHVVDGLDERHAAVIRLRFEDELDSAAIRRRLGVSSQWLEKLVAEAYRRVGAQLDGADAPGSMWVRRQRSLLLVWELGMASPRQRARAQKMVAEDAACRAMLREIRVTLKQAAAVVAVPTGPDSHADDLPAVGTRGTQMIDTSRRRRGPERPPALVSRVPGAMPPPPRIHAADASPGEWA
jgi:hypothetical protein